MKSLAIALGTLATVVAPAVFAQDYYERRDDTSERGYVYVPNPNYERQFDSPRSYYRDERLRDDRWGDSRRAYRDGQYECWNPRARHYEGVREGERQDDLDFSRCRGLRTNNYRR